MLRRIRLAVTMAEMKWILDWLLSAVNLIIPHAFYFHWPRGAERPDVGPHNLWWPHYRSLLPILNGCVGC